MPVAHRPLEWMAPEQSRSLERPRSFDEELFSRFSSYVARVGFRLLGRDADVEELVQEVFLAAYKQPQQLLEATAARGWLSVISVRTARRLLRRRRLRRFVGLDDLVPSFESRDPSLAADTRALLSRVYEALDRVDVECRLAWTLRYLEGDELEDVAKRCDCSPAIAQRRIAAAQSFVGRELRDG